MKTLFDSEARREILERLGRLTPESSRRWGKMDVSKMVCHLRDHFLTALGDIDAGGGIAPMTWAPLKWLGIETAPEMLQTEPETFERDVAALRQVIERFVALGPEGAFHAHPLFGPLSGEQWGRLAYRHLDHHLRQFGV